MRLSEYAAAELERWRAAGLERSERSFASAQTPRCTVDGRPMRLFSSSNYLGLSEHPRLHRAAAAATARFGAGSGGSRLTTGTTELHQEAEGAMASFTGYPSAQLFATGYQANVSTLQALASPELTIVSDSLNHASIIDGCRLAKAAGATVVVTPHGDLAAVEGVLRERSTQRALVVSDALFSMSGALAPVAELRELCDAHGAWLYLDDAHGIGTLGPSGRGIGEETGVKADILVATASKALGAEGGFVCADRQVCAWLRNASRSYVYSTAPSPATCAAILAALEILSDETSPVPALHERVAQARRLLRSPGHPRSPVIQIRVGAEDKAVAAAHALADAGFVLPAIRYPTVAKGQAMLRVTCMATHSAEDFRCLGTQLDRVLV